MILPLAGKIGRRRSEASNCFAAALLNSTLDPSRYIMRVVLLLNVAAWAYNFQVSSLQLLGHIAIT